MASPITTATRNGVCIMLARSARGELMEPKRRVLNRGRSRRETRNVKHGGAP